MDNNIEYSSKAQPDNVSDTSSHLLKKTDENTLELLPDNESNSPRKVFVDDNVVENLVILKGNINVDCMDPSYASKVMNLDLFKLVKCESTTFIDVIGLSLDVDNYDISDTNEESKSDKKNIIHNIDLYRFSSSN